MPLLDVAPVFVAGLATADSDVCAICTGPDLAWRDLSSLVRALGGLEPVGVSMRLLVPEVVVELLMRGVSGRDGGGRAAARADSSARGSSTSCDATFCVVGLGLSPFAGSDGLDGFGGFVASGVAEGMSSN